MAAEAKSKPSVAELAKEHGLEPYINNNILMIVEMADNKTVKIPVEAVLAMESNASVEEVITRNGNKFTIAATPRILPTMGVQMMCLVLLPDTVPSELFKKYFGNSSTMKYCSVFGAKLHGNNISDLLAKPYRSHAALVTDAKRAIDEICKLYGWACNA
jgi:hypothetical protein